jgi:GNAT superfamily N-acetyltransferase
VKVVRCAEAAAFVELAQAWLMRAELEHNVMLSVATSIADGSRAVPPAPYFAAALDDAGVVACAVRTLPYKLMLSRGSEAGIGALVRDVYEATPGLPAVNGPEPAALTFARGWSALAQRPFEPGKHLRLYAAHAVATNLPRTAGSLREAHAAERPLALEWAAAFAREATPHEPLDREELIDRLYAGRTLFMWEHHGPTVMLACGGRTLNGARVSLVYSPPALRRRGYATAAVAALTARLLATGAKYCCLYTDLANPTPNSVYQQVGYRAVCDFNDYHFAS